MIALLAAASLAVAAAEPPVLPPDAVLAQYRIALAGLREPRVFAFEYTVQQTGTRSIEQRHRVFRSGSDERDETLAVNGNRTRNPVVRVFRRRPYRYTVAALAPKPSAYDFVYAGPHRDGKHVDYVFTLVPKGKPQSFAFTQVTIDGLTFLPQTVAFADAKHAAHGSVTFAKADRYWVARAASAEANASGGVAREQLSFGAWRFPKALPPSTFSLPRPLPTLPPALPAAPGD
ncbi:MAG TPA: hypothetical protein VE826_07295 [Dongiaceae bacterium]|nr:hypothetical protein [Dongiaceae bacterium]